MVPAIEVKNFFLKKGDFQLKNISFEIHAKEIFAILGKTGAGKTMLLESIAGFYRGIEGGIYLGGCNVHSIPLAERKIGFVYQDYGLFPHMTVKKNISYGLKMQKISKEERKKRVSHMAEIMSISHILDQHPNTLSGGEKQRTALARSLVLSPNVLLLDEPFSALDPVTKRSMYKEILKINEQFDCAIIFVTHDFMEAQKLAHRIGIVEKGCLTAVRKSNELFHSYQNEEMNQFLGIRKGECI